MKLVNGRSIIFGVQHLLAMYAGAVAVPLLIGTALHFNETQMTYLISTDIFMCGVATLLQVICHRYIGIGLPIMMGCAIQTVTPLITIGQTQGIGAIYGSIIAAGIIVFLIAPFFAKLKRLFPPIVTGSIITVIGLTLIPVAIEKIGGSQPTSNAFGSPKSLIIAGVTILTILLIQRFGKGFIQSIAILIGMIVGTIIASFLAHLNMDVVVSAPLIQIPKLFYFGTPQFDISSILLMVIVSIICMIESTGCYFAIADLTNQPIGEQDLARGYRSEGIAIILGGLFNTFPYTSYSQNIGLLKLSGIKTKGPIISAALLLIVLGLFPKFGAIAQMIPDAVLGAGMLFMFSMVAVQGLSIIAKTDLTNQRNILVIALSIGLGVGLQFQPQISQHLPSFVQLFTTNGIIVTSIVAVILNVLLNHSIDK